MERASRSSLVTISVSPGCSVSSAFCSARRPLVLLPDIFSENTLLQPAALSLSIWPLKSWSTELTRAYPILATFISVVEYRHSEQGYAHVCRVNIPLGGLCGMRAAQKESWRRLGAERATMAKGELLCSRLYWLPYKRGYHVRERAAKKNQLHRQKCRDRCGREGRSGAPLYASARRGHSLALPQRDRGPFLCIGRRADSRNTCA